jgi:tRNA G37 N-methylase TrmD
MKKPKIIRDAERVARMCFVGIAIPYQPSLADGVYGPIRSEKILKFNRTALRNIGKKKLEKADPRLVGGDDLMIVKVGKPGSRERVDALAAQYAAVMTEGEEVSPFAEG